MGGRGQRVRPAPGPCHHRIEDPAGLCQGGGGGRWPGWCGQGELTLGRASDRLPGPRRELIGEKAQAVPFDPQEPSRPALAVSFELAGEVRHPALPIACHF